MNRAGEQLKTKLYCSSFCLFLHSWTIFHPVWIPNVVPNMCQQIVSGLGGETVELSSRSQGGTMLSLLRTLAEPQPAATSVRQESQLMAILSQLSLGLLAALLLHHKLHQSLQNLLEMLGCFKHGSSVPVLVCCSLGTWASLGMV